jgi:ubiquitin conjugation factor E4 B
MSGFLPDLANWALRGGAGEDGAEGNSDNSNEDGGDEGATPAPEPAITESDMRARRLARMEAMERRQQELRQQQQQELQQDPQPMEVDTTPSPKATMPIVTTTPMEMEATPPVTKKAKADSVPATSTPTSPKPKKPTTPLDRVQRKKELLIKKILQLTFLSRQTRDTACLHVEIDLDGGIGIQTIAELLATRLSMPPSELQSTVPHQKSFIMYLATVHRKAAEEYKTLRQQQKDSNAPLLEMLQEIQTQAVSYAASGLMMPDMFEQAADSRSQLLLAMIETCGSGDPLQSLTYGVRTGKSDSSFYHKLCDELDTQDSGAFEAVVTGLATKIYKSLKKCETLESTVTVKSDNDGGDLYTQTLSVSCGPTQLLSALQAICGHKKVALAVVNLPEFLLPPANTPAADETIRPPMPQGADIFRMLAGAGSNHKRPYKKRSGVGLEEHTLLGSVFKISTPRNNNPAFASSDLLRQSPTAVKQVTTSQRHQIRVYQTLCNQLVMSFVKAGKEARNALFKWFVDCQLVNPGATAMRPDYQSKVSSPALLLNVSVALLKLCEPFVSDEKKHGLIDSLFVLSAEDNRGVFPARGEGGDDALPRLGDDNTGDNDASMSKIPPYKPKNAFIPQCFFYTARSLALGIVPLLSQHESLLRHLSHRHWELNNSNTELTSDPQFRMLLSRQRSHEVPLFQEEMVTDTLHFCDLMAKILYKMDNDEFLKSMPEHFVDNLCDILMSIGKMQPKMLRGMQFPHVFLLMVKLLSPKYVHMVRNYNLRATLGDVLHELFLPIDDKTTRRRDVPEGIALDPTKGGQSYLLSDVSAQETLAPSLLLLYGEVEYTGHYEKMSHRAKISSLLKYLWESKEHQPAFQKITQNKESFIKFANGIINETNQLISTVIQKLPEIKATQEQMANAAAWGRLTEEEQSDASSRLEDNERDVKSALPLCNKTLQMFGYLNTDSEIRRLFLLPELCPRLVNMLIHVLEKLVGSKQMDLKVCMRRAQHYIAAFLCLSKCLFTFAF